MTQTDVEFKQLDTTDVDRWIGVPLGGGEMKEPVDANDIRRWSQGMQNPKPLYFDEAYARRLAVRELVAPQSFAVCTGDSHGAGPAIQGNIPGTHMIFGGDEWWFFGPRIEPGDRIALERMLFDYKVTETKFAGPTMFSRGDTTYIKQRGEVVCKQRSTSIRYLAEKARSSASFAGRHRGAASGPTRSSSDREAKLDYYRTLPGSRPRKRPAVVKVGEPLPTRPIGPHTIASFTSEWRAFLMTVWGACDATTGARLRSTMAGWLPEMSRDRKARRSTRRTPTVSTRGRRAATCSRGTRS